MKFLSVFIFLSFYYTPFSLRDFLCLYSKVWTIVYHSCQLCCDEFDFMITKASSLQFIGENTFSASELYLLYISLCTLIFYFNPIIGFRICMRAISISCSGILVKSIPQKVDIFLCSAKYCIPAVRIANCIFSVFGDSDA